MSIKLFLIVGFGGFIGASFRFFISQLFLKYSTINFPISTLIVNIIGSFLIGLIFSYSEKFDISLEHKIFITTGLLGALTTFSTFSLEVLLMLENANIKLAILTIFLNISLSILFVFLGRKIYFLFML